MRQAPRTHGIARHKPHRREVGVGDVLRLERRPATLGFLQYRLWKICKRWRGKSGDLRERVRTQIRRATDYNR